MTARYRCAFCSQPGSIRAEKGEAIPTCPSHRAALIWKTIVPAVRNEPRERASADYLLNLIGGATLLTGGR